MSHKEDHFLKVATSIALESGRIQLASLGRVREVRFKSDINLVTEVDGRCEGMIPRRLRKAFPGHDILTEEAGILQKGKDRSEFRWIVDPLDGTTNYAHGYPLFCTSIALEYRGEVILGVVYDPNHRELFCAIRGEGAFRNRRRIHVSKTRRLRRSLLSTGFAYNVREADDNNFSHFWNFIMLSQAVRRDGVAAVDLCYVACGRYDGFWELGLWPWDVAAGALIVLEAGGRVSGFGKGRFSIYEKQIAASNGKVHREMLRVIRNGKGKR